MNEEYIKKIRRNWKQIKFFDLINHILFGILIVLVIIIIGIKISYKLTRKYVYVDMNGSTGKSQTCYYSESSRDMRCLIPVKVQQYSEEK